MSLLVWLPLNGNTNNKGLLYEGDMTNVNTITYENSPFGTGIHVGNGIAYKSGVSFTLPNTFSIAGWAKIDIFSAAYVNLFTLTNDNNNWNGIGTGGSSGQLGWHVRKADNSGYYTDNYAFNNKVTYGKWFHFALVLNGTNVKQYLNGEQINDSSTNGTYSPITYNKIILGSKFSDGSGTLQSNLNDFRIYDHALSVKEVKELAKGLVMNIPFDWGGNPNMIKNSYTWMNNFTGSNNINVSAKSIAWDNFAPSPYVYSVTVANSTSSAVSGSAGTFYSISNQGLTTSDLTSGATYTYSFWAKIDGDTNNGNTGFAQGSIAESQTIVSYSGFGALSTAWRKHTVTFTWTNINKLTCCFYINVPANTTYTFKVCGIKLEAGAKATPYQPNSAETVYTSEGFATKAFEDVSGYNKNATNTGCTNGGSNTPRGLSCTSRVAANRIVLTPIFNNGTKIYNLTTSIWAKTNTLNSTNPQLWCLGQNTFWRARLLTSTSMWSYAYVGTTAVGTTVTIPNALDNVWHNYAITFNNGVIKTYFDGVLKNTTDYSSTATYLTCNSQIWSLGDYASNSEAFVGSLSDFRIYASTLSDADILALYNTAASIDKSGNFYCNTLEEI